MLSSIGATNGGGTTIGDPWNLMTYAPVARAESA